MLRILPWNINAHIILYTLSLECIDSLDYCVKVLYDVSERIQTPTCKKVKWNQTLLKGRKTCSRVDTLLGPSFLLYSLHLYFFLSINSIINPVLFYKACIIVISTPFTSCIVLRSEGLSPTGCSWKIQGNNSHWLGLITCSLSWCCMGLIGRLFIMEFCDWQHTREQCGWSM